MCDAPPDRLLSPDGKSGWYAFPPEGYVPLEDEPWTPPPKGSTIRLMGEYEVEVPLWSGGLLFDGREELETCLGVSEGLATDLVAWALAWNNDNGRRTAKMDCEAANLVHRLDNELGDRYTFVYQP